MAEIVQFPRHSPPPAPRLVWPPAPMAVEDILAAVESEAEGRQCIAKALENLASVNTELCCINTLSISNGGDVAGLVSDEVVIGICHALTAVIDARGSRNIDLPLRRAAAELIAERENNLDR